MLIQKILFFIFVLAIINCGLESQENSYKWRVEQIDKLISQAKGDFKEELIKKKDSFQKEYQALPVEKEQRSVKLGKLNSGYYKYLDEAEEKSERLAEAAKDRKTELAKEAMQKIVGDWQGIGMDLTITPDGSVVYKRVSGGTKKNINGSISRYSNEEFEVTVLGFSTTFRIDKLPFKENEKFKMIIDGVKLTRIQ